MMKRTRRIVTALCLVIVSAFVFCACSNGKTNTATDDNAQYNGKLEFDHAMELTYAKNFSVDYYKGGYKLIKINDGKQFLTVPENMNVPENLEAGITVLKQPVDNMMISSAPVMSLLHSINALDKVALTTGEESSWYIEDVKTKMAENAIRYVGSYKEPDYEMLVAVSPKLSVFSSMLSTTPEVAEKFDELGLPYFVDGSTYEEQPMARVEWVKLYGALFGCEDAANKVFEEQKAYVDGIGAAATGKKVSVFYITTSGVLYARQGGDYVARMVELAGGTYAPETLDKTKTGTQKMGIEDFYAQAKDSDYIVYIWSLGGKPENLEQFAAKNELFADFKAVQEGNVWCTTPDFFQISDTLGYMVKDLNTMLTDTSAEQLTYLFRLK